MVINKKQKMIKKNEEVDEIIKENQRLEKEENVEGLNSKKHNRLLKIILIISVILLFISGLLIYLSIPRIDLKGSSNVIITYKDTYKELGYTAKNFYKDFTKEVKVKSNLKKNKLGTYKITYSIKKFGITFKKSRNIKIVDKEKPTISVESKELTVCPNKEVPEITYTAIDEYDGDLTNKIIKTVTDNEIILKVIDSSKNETKTKINIIREDKEKPTIQLNGNYIMFSEFGYPYSEPGYTAFDNCSKDLNSSVKVNGEVGRNIGSYTLTYEVTDEAGNKATTTRKVIVGTTVKDYGTAPNGSIYLTFDDGPNEGTTNKILDVLKEENVQATFFVTGKGPDYLINRIVNEGHQIALHTNSHDYSYVYSSTTNYFNDLNAVATRVKNLTGIDSKIIRFPGGSSNTVSKSYQPGIMTELSNLVLSQGYRYYDWNIDSLDAGGAGSSNEVFYNVTTKLSPNRANMVLMHDIKWTTADAIRDIILYGKNNNYTFKKIDMDTYMIRHGINN